MIASWLTWLLNIPAAVYNLLFSLEIMQNISIGSTLLYFGLVMLAIIFLNKFFWGKANG